jgi:post-segregation antitoxin (ccd killing protein)
VIFLAKGGKQPKRDFVRVLVYLPRDLYEKAKKKKEETGVSISHVARKAVAAWVEEKKG